MYDAFDAFLGTSTWHTRHPNDLERFYRALHDLVREPTFNADTMAEHMTAKAGNPALDCAVDHYRAAAWAVREYLDANGLL